MNKLIFSLMFAALSLSQLTLAQADLPHYRGKNRLLLVFALSKADPRWRTQNTLLAGSAADFKERDVLRFDYLEHGGEVSGGLRTRYGIKPGQFRVLLIGKDGQVASGSPIPISLQALKEQIDRMPMRREEIKAEEIRRRHQSG